MEESILVVRIKTQKHTKQNLKVFIIYYVVLYLYKQPQIHLEY